MLAGFEVAGVYYDITTTAEYTGTIEVAIPYDETQVEGPEENLKLWHWDPDVGWTDCTTWVDTENNIIYGEVTSLSVFVVGEPLITATFDVDPDTINLKSKGKWITCYIELPEEYDVNDIDVASVRFEGSLPAAEKPYGVGDEDQDEIPDLMVKFARAGVGSLLAWGDSVEVTVSGAVLGETFSGTDIIRVFMPGRHAERDSTVRKLRVRQNYPNPFNLDTKIAFNITHTSNVKVEIFNILGQRVNTLLDGHLEAGEHTVEWDGQGSNGQPLAGGIYFYRLTAGDMIETIKMILLR